jgi:hypothetical protein
MSILAILAEKRAFFADLSDSPLPTEESISPSVVYHHQESSGKTGYSALMDMSL